MKFWEFTRIDKTVIGVCVAIILTVLLLAACGDVLSPGFERKETESGIDYEFFYIEGMPCIYVKRDFGKFATGGPSCDWSKWKDR